MQQTDKATPRPWYEADDLEVVTRQGFTIASILHDDGFVTNEQASADRALIVRAVNNHDALVEALRDAAWGAHDRHDFDYAFFECPEDYCAEANAALAKAEGA